MLERLRDLFEEAQIPHASALAVADLGPERGSALIVGVRAGPNRLLVARQGKLLAEPLTELADPFGSARAIAAGDLDGDGIEEIWIANGDPDRPKAPHADRLFDAYPGGFRDLLAEHPTLCGPLAPSSLAALAFDRTGEGRFGFLVAGAKQPIRLIEQGEDGFLSDCAAYLGLDEILDARIVAQGPGSGRGLEFFIGAGCGPSAWFVPDGAGRFVECSEALDLRAVDLDLVDAAFLDADGTGTVALFCVRRRGAQLLWLRDTTGALRNVAPACLARVSAARALVIADLDNDGFEEIFIANAGEPNRLLGFRERGWRPLDPGEALEPTTVPTAALAADLDEDGRLELVIARAAGAGGGLACYRVADSDNNWIRIAPRTRNGAPARGALVRLAAQGRIQWRIVGGSRGNGEPVAHFGLGECTRIEWVDVRWPDGAVKRLRAPEPRRTLVVDHPRARVG